MNSGQGAIATELFWKSGKGTVQRRLRVHRLAEVFLNDPGRSKKLRSAERYPAGARLGLCLGRGLL
jgi:hypothetical protein